MKLEGLVLEISFICIFLSFFAADNLKTALRGLSLVHVVEMIISHKDPNKSYKIWVCHVYGGTK